MHSNPQVISALEHAAAEFINRESNRRSLITVTRVELDDHKNKAIVFVSVYPDAQAPAALDFLSRVTDDFYDYVREHIKMRSAPRFSFQQDPNLGGFKNETMPEVPSEKN
ncbi:MAG: ribosome-binding factor A [Patescibacteria group bacterium]